MKDVLRPILELTVVFPGLLLAYFPVRSYLKQSSAKLAVWEVPLLFGLCLGGGLFCYHFGLSTAFPLLLITIVTIFLYLKTLRLSLWKSGTIALAVCAVFACLNSLSRAVGTAITIRLQLPPDKPWFCFSACIFYNVICWLTAAAAYYPSTHAVRAMVEDDNFAQTWYVFWVLPMVFILLNLFITPRYQITLRIGRVLQVYIVMSIALLFLLFMFIKGVFAGTLSGSLNALIAEASGYTTRTTGVHMDGMMYSCSSLGVKVGGGIGTAAVGWLLKLGGFVGTATVQSESAIRMIFNLYITFPFVIGIIITVLLAFLDVEKANKKWDAEHQKEAQA